MIALTMGNQVYLEAAGLEVACRVLATKSAYGHERVQLEPVSGRGRTWVDRRRVRLAPRETFARCDRTTCQRECQADELILTPQGLLICRACAGQGWESCA